jgi:hypothetical protein
VDDAQAEDARIELDGRVEVAHGDPDVIDAGQQCRSPVARLMPDSDRA